MNLSKPRRYVPNYEVSSADDRIYYNIAIPGSRDFTEALFNVQLNQSIIDVASDYYLAVTRFTIPTSTVPILIPEIDPYPNTDINKTIYSFTMTYQNYSSGRVHLQFVPTNNATAPAAPTATSPNVNRTNYYFIYVYQPFIDMMNTTIQNAFNLLDAAVPGGLPVGAVAPYFIYDSSTERINLISQIANYDQSDPLIIDPIYLYANATMYQFLDGIPAYYYNFPVTEGKSFRFIIENTNNNLYVAPNTVGPATQYIMFQQYDALQDWNTLKSLQITSNQLPISKEYVPSLSATRTQEGITNTAGVLADFEIFVDKGPDARTTVQYSQVGPYHLINMNANIPIQKIDIQVYWTTNQGDRYLLQVPYGQTLTVKLAFIRKETFTS